MKAGLKLNRFTDIESTVTWITKIIIVTVLGVNLSCVLIFFIQVFLLFSLDITEGILFFVLSIYISFSLVYVLALFLLRYPVYQVFTGLLTLISLNIQISFLNYLFSADIYLLYFIMPVLSYFIHDYQANSASRGYKLIISNRAC